MMMLELHTSLLRTQTDTKIKGFIDIKGQSYYCNNYNIYSYLNAKGPFARYEDFYVADSHERTGVEKGESIQKYYNTQSSSWNQQLCVPA